MTRQGTAERNQLCCFGSTRFGLSRLPAWTYVYSGCRAELVNSADPHCGQKLRLSATPLSELFVKILTCPRVIINAAVSILTLIPNALPDRRRQSSQ